METLRTRLGDRALAERLGVQPNQFNVWRKRGKVSAQARLVLEGLAREAEAPAPELVEALHDQRALLERLVRAIEATTATLAEQSVRQTEILTLLETVRLSQDRQRGERLRPREARHGSGREAGSL